MLQVEEDYLAPPIDHLEHFLTLRNVGFEAHFLHVEISVSIQIVDHEIDFLKKNSCCRIDSVKKCCFTRGIMSATLTFEQMRSSDLQIWQGAGVLSYGQTTAVAQQTGSCPLVENQSGESRRVGPGAWAPGNPDPVQQAGHGALRRGDCAAVAGGKARRPSPLVGVRVGAIASDRLHVAVRGQETGDKNPIREGGAAV